MELGWSKYSYGYGRLCSIFAVHFPWYFPTQIRSIWNKNWKKNFFSKKNVFSKNFFF